MKKIKRKISAADVFDRHIGDSLHSPCCRIMSSDEDQPIVMDLYAGFNARGQLMICADYYDYDCPAYNCSTAAIVDPEDSHSMARSLKVKHSRLPIFIAQCMSDWSYVVNPRCSQVVACFKEITDCLLEEGCRFRIERTYGKGGYVCC